jgi:hypothetical protein
MRSVRLDCRRLAVRSLLAISSLLLDRYFSDYSCRKHPSLLRLL